MTWTELEQEVGIELENMETAVQELLALREDVQGRTPTVRERTAAAGFLVQFYNGIENILKRIARFHTIPLPHSENWHADLFKQFCTPPTSPLPQLFDPAMAARLAPFRKFRHVVYHGYGFQLDWDRMADGVNQVEHLFSEFKSNLTRYFESTQPL